MFWFEQCRWVYLLKKYVLKAKLQQSDLIPSTKLRKYVETMSHVLNMSHIEFLLVCRHMGHSIKVHEHFYQLPSQTLELAKISKLLIAVEGGDLNSLFRKKLNELDIDDIPFSPDKDSNTPNGCNEDKLKNCNVNDQFAFFHATEQNLRGCSATRNACQ